MGFRIHETMAGEHEFQDGKGPPGRHPFAFRVTWGPDRLREWLDPTSDRFLWQELEGEVRIGGLCDWTPCRGTLELRYPERRIVYDFDVVIDGVAYRFRGQKSDIRLWNLPVSHTTCHGTLTERASNALVSTSVTTFKLRSLPRFLASLRWVS